MNKLLHKISLLVLLPLALSGCLKDLDLEEQGVAAGAAVGGAAGYMLCRLKGNDPEDCRLAAVAGAAAGVVAGGLYGRSMEDRRQAYASDEEFYDAQITELRQVNAQLRKEREGLDEKLSAVRAEAEQITNELSTAEAKQQKFEESRKQALDQKKQLDSRIAEYKEELNVNQQILTDSRAKGSDDADTLATEIAQLQEEIASLDGLSDELAAISSVTF